VHPIRHPSRFAGCRAGFRHTLTPDLSCDPGSEESSPSARKSVACTSLRTSRYLIYNSSCFTKACVASDKPLLRVSIWEVFRSVMSGEMLKFEWRTFSQINSEFTTP
jgi:hypothetical protein